MSGATYQKLDRSEADDPSDESSSEEEYDALSHRPPRTSEDTRRHDQETLTAEEAAERLLAGGNEKASARRAERRDERRQRRRERRRNRTKKKYGEGSEMMYEMEEGGPRDSSAESSERSSESDMHRLAETQARQKSSKASRFGKFAVVHVVVIIAFMGLLYGAYRASHTMSKSSNGTASIAQTLSNGTHTFAPTTLLISLDGFRADFLTRNLTPTLNSFIRSGVSPKYMLPSFPSLTFPNHFTLVTGLHPESHGVVGNTFWDPTTQKEFFYTDPHRSMQPEWWDAEPLWLTAELAGVKSAIHMWPGSEAHIGNLEPTYVDEFDDDEELQHKVDRIFSWLDLPGPMEDDAREDEPRPQFIAAYVPNVDADGHKYGPNSTYIRSTIKQVDGMLGSLFDGIDERNLTDIVNIIVVSDHGMATTSNNRLVQLGDLIDTSLIEHTDGWPLYGLRPYDDSKANIKKIYDALLAESKQPKYKHAFDVYLRDKTMPARYHFASNPRIAPLWIVPRTGWAIVTKDEFNIAEAKKTGAVYYPRGLHGYDHEHPLMRAIFVARGPAFPHPQGSLVAEFQNTEVYNIVCDSLGIEPKENNGTLRLPFQTKGKHEFDSGWVDVEIPEDPQENEVQNLNDFLLPPDLPVTPSPPTRPETPERPTRPVESGKVDGTGAAAVPTRPIVHDGLTQDEEEPKEINRWWDWVKGKLDAIRGWAKGTWEGKTGEEEQKGEGGRRVR